MNIYKYFGKLVLVVSIPVAFVVVSSIVLSLLIACIGTLSSDSSFSQYFSTTLGCGAIEFLMSIVAFGGMVMYFQED